MDEKGVENGEKKDSEIHGPVEMPATAAMVSAKTHNFETNPVIRKRVKNRLLKKLNETIKELTIRTGQQAVLLMATPETTTSFKCFGAKPLEDVVKKHSIMIMNELASALNQKAPSPLQEDPLLYELPPIMTDGIPTPVEQMTQAQMRAFIPLMLKYSTGREKPGWGKESTRPPWWPIELPWANVRLDARSKEEKQRLPWTHALRQIIINCYKYHGRDDLLKDFSEEEENSPLPISAQYSPDILSTVSKLDGSVSKVEVEPNPIITLPDSPTAQAQAVATIHTDHDYGTAHTTRFLTEVCNIRENVDADLYNYEEDLLNQDSHFILTGEDGDGMISSLYRTVVANIHEIHTQGGGTIQKEMRDDRGPEE